MTVPRQTKVLIVGCGSLGSSLAARLSPHVMVTGYDVRGRRIQVIRRKGLVFRQGRRKDTRKIQVADRLAQLEGQFFDAVIVATKCADVRSAAQDISRSCVTKRVLFLQNGDFSLDWTRRMFRGADVCRGVTTTAVQLGGDGRVDVFYGGELYLGVHSGQASCARWFADIFQSAGIRSRVMQDYRRAVWAKLIFSSVMNPLPIMFGTGYAVIRRDVKAYRLVQRAIREGMAVASALGIRLAFDPARLVSRVRRDRHALAHQGSMYHDFLEKKPLEIDHITGVIIREARRLGLETPVLSMIYQTAKKAAGSYA